MKDVLRRLAEPFPEKTIQWLPQSVTKDGQRALAVAYIDPRDVQRRLDEVVGMDWSFQWEPISETEEVNSAGRKDVLITVRGTLTVQGTTRSDVGEGHKSRAGYKAAVSDAIKRCGVQFGIGR